MEQIIKSVYHTLEGNNVSVNDPTVPITPDRIINWTNQFDNYLRIPILVEFYKIFKNRYYSKSKIKEFLDKVIQVLTNDFNFKITDELLEYSEFLNPQPEGKSQRIILRLYDMLI